MRNRGIEIHVSGAQTQEDSARLSVSRRLPEGASTDPVLFEMRRRGLNSAVSSSACNLPSGQLLGDSIVSYNKDLVATMNSTSTSPLASASLLFLTRSLSAPHSPAFIRLLASDPSVGDLRPLLHLTKAFVSDSRWCKIEAMRRTFSQIWPVSSDLLRVEVSTHHPLPSIRDHRFCFRRIIVADVLLSVNKTSPRTSSPSSRCLHLHALSWKALHCNVQFCE